MTDPLASTWDTPASELTREVVDTLDKAVAEAGADLVAEIEWYLLSHVYCFANDKGGVGKTTASSHSSALMAADGLRVLLVDLNGQGNVAEDFGFTDADGVDDDGKGLYAAVTVGIPLQPRSIRPNLDIIPGGKWVRKIPAFMSGEMKNPQQAARMYTALARALLPIAGNYDAIVLDTPPENEEILSLALGASRFVIVPMKTDASSRKGLLTVARLMREVRAFNPYLFLLGIFLFASGKGATRIRQDMKDGVQEDFNNSAYVFEAFIRHSESAASNIRANGKMVHELEQLIRQDPSQWKVRAGARRSATQVSDSNSGVAEDFQRLTREILLRSVELRESLKAKGMWP